MRVIEERFIKFLEDEGALEAFRENLRQCSGETVEEHLGGVGVINITAYVASAFGWSTSPEGYDYWDDIEDLWLEELNK